MSAATGRASDMRVSHTSVWGGGSAVARRLRIFALNGERRRESQQLLYGFRIKHAQVTRLVGVSSYLSFIGFRIPRKSLVRTVEKGRWVAGSV